MTSKKNDAEPLAESDLDNVQGGGVKNIGLGSPTYGKVKRKAPAGPGDKDGKGDKLDKTGDDFAAAESGGVR